MSSIKETIGIIAIFCGLVSLVFIPVSCSLMSEVSSSAYYNIQSDIRKHPELFPQFYIDDLLADGKISQYEYQDIQNRVEEKELNKDKSDAIKFLKNRE